MMQYNLAIIIGAGVLGLVINLLPTIIAFIKNTYNKVTVLMLNIIPWLLSLFVTLITTFVVTPNTSSNAILAIAGVIGVIISLINIVLWIVAFIKAIRG